jgi:hypothetical protein
MTTKQKFKIGDILLVTRTRPAHNISMYHPKDGDLVTVDRVDLYPSDGDHVYFFKECLCGRFQSELEISELSYSPLWEALR